MGNALERANNIKKKIIKQTKGLQIGVEFNCPNCGVSFPAKAYQKQVQQHLHVCSEKLIENKKQKPSIKAATNQEILFSYHLDQYIYVKEPLDDSYTQFCWKKIAIKQFQPFHINLQAQQISKMPFQQKGAWFRGNLQNKRIHWQNGADYLKIHRDNVLMSSLISCKKVNMYKQVKVQFQGDKVNDAGGLLREWMHLVIKQIFDQYTGIFVPCKTDDLMYRLKWDEDIDQQFSGQLLTLLGTILGKAIFEKISINMYLDRTLLRQLSSKKAALKLTDVFGYDKQNWKYLEQKKIDDLDLGLTFVLNKQDQESKTINVIDLIEDGSTIQVNDQNKKMYIDLYLQTICRDKVSRSIEYIRKGLYKIIPEQLISVFQPYELQMLIYGVPYIDVKDWKNNTQYKGQYKPQHQIIKWFWEVVQLFNQQQLANLLKFATGSSRTPIHGFKKLQSNRGNYSKFLIQPSIFSNANPYPKGHTCFNRLQLPKYHKKQQLKLYVTAVANSNNLDGVFGLD